MKSSMICTFLLLNTAWLGAGEASGTPGPAAGDQPIVRVWTLADGRGARLELVQWEEERVLLRSPSGRDMWVPRNKLSDADQQWLKQHERARQLAEELARLKGRWRWTCQLRGGHMLPVVGEIDLVIDDDAMTLINRAPRRSIGAEFHIDPQTTPKQITKIMPAGPNKGKGKPLRGIYRLDGDTLELCFRADNVTPKDFDTSGFVPAIVEHYERKKDGT